MADPLRIRAVQPLRFQRCAAFVDREPPGRSGLEIIDEPVYPPSPRGTELRKKRMAAGLTLGDAARRAGISVVEWCGLEMGSHVPEDWEVAFAVLKAPKPPPAAPPAPEQLATEAAP